MQRINGLTEYVQTAGYRQALGLPEEKEETYVRFAQGEYNINYRFTHPVTGRELLLRVNCGSQMHLEDQIGYEYRALKALWPCGRTPRPLYVDGSRRHLDYGVMVMEYLPGRALDYRQDMKQAAELLADIHSLELPGGMIPEAGDATGLRSLIAPEKPLEAILLECEEMVKCYMESQLADEGTKRQIRRMLDAEWRRVRGIPDKQTYRCCINTELNSTNFLMNGEKNYLIDWEKPIYGDPAQDLGHFLAPTTTFWKTDIILDKKEREQFVEDYIQAARERFPTDGLRERVSVYVPVTCLRGITWCAMTWIEYQQPDRVIFNESTYKKLGEYLDRDFLDRIEAGA